MQEIAHEDRGDGRGPVHRLPRRPSGERRGGGGVMRVLVTGAGGMLGRDLLPVLAARTGLEVDAAPRAVLDVTDPAAVERVIGGYDVVVNCAA